MMGRACRPPLGYPRPSSLPPPFLLFLLAASGAHLVPWFVREESRESRYVSGISNADSSYRPLYLQREYKGWWRCGGARERTTPRKRYPLSMRSSCTVATCTAARTAVPFRPPDGRAAVADKLPHYAYAAYAPPKFAAGSPCSQPLKTLSTSSASWPRSLPAIYVCVYIYIPPLSPLLSRASLHIQRLSLSRFSVFLVTFPPTSILQLPRRFYFLLPVSRRSTSLNVSFCDAR